VTTNIATGGDRIPVQVGRIPGKADAVHERGEMPADDADPTGEAGTVNNTRTENAHVGVQADAIVGGLIIDMRSRA
jgi:hypothetical protein